MKTPSKKRLTELVLIATVVVGQAHAGTTLKAKTINNANKQTSVPSKALIKVKHQHKVLKAAPITPVKNSAARRANAKKPVINNRAGATPANSAIANQPPIRNGLKSRLNKKNVGKQFNNPRALNGAKRLNPIEALRPSTQGAEGTVNGAPTVPNTARPSIIGQDGATRNGVNEQTTTANNAFIPATINTYEREGLSTITNMETGAEILVHTPSGGLPQGLGALRREGDMFIFEADGAMTFIPVAQTDQAGTPAPGPGVTSPAGEKPGSSNPSDKPSSKPVGKDTSGGGKDTSGGGKDTSGGGKDTSGGGKDTSGGGKDTSGGGKDTSGGGKDTDTGTKGEGTTKRGANGSNHNQHGSGDVVGDFMGNKTGEKKHVESAQPQSGGEDHGSNPVTQPGPEGGSNSVPGNLPTVGDGSDSGNAGPKNNLWTNPYISPEERRNTTVNPGRFEEHGDEINHAVDTLEDIGHAVNPRR